MLGEFTGEQKPARVVDLEGFEDGSFAGVFKTAGVISEFMSMALEETHGSGCT